VDYRDNDAPRAWISLDDSLGELVMQVFDTAAVPLLTATPAHPLVWRSLPSATDWSLQTRFRLASRQYGNYVAGLQVIAIESGATNRYVLGIENGTTLSVQRVDSGGTTAVLQSQASDVAEIIIRIRRSGDNLVFEQKTANVWSTLLTQPLVSGSTTGEGGILLATSLPQSIRVNFDYAMLVDPSNTSELRENLRIAEIMYNPVGGDDFEYVELVNIGTTALDLTGARFTEGIQFAFGAASLPPGARIVVVKDTVSFASRYGSSGISVASGVFTGRLDNGGERITLVDAVGNVVQSFVYGDSGGWPERADGNGSSLEIVNPRGDYTDSRNWNSSSEYLGSPGVTGTGPIVSVVINEVLTHTDPPLQDSVELHNPTPNDVNIGGWYLSDDGAVLKKYRIPGNTVVPAGGYLVLTEQQFNNTNNPATIPFSFDSARGDDVWLTAADAAGNLTVFVDNVDFGASENGVSFGRFPNGSGPLTTMSRLTFGATNAYPKVGPIVIHEIMYHPTDQADEYIELLNITGQDVPLFDPLHPTNTWKLADAVEFVFPTNVVIATGGRILVVPMDGAAFRSKYAVQPEIAVFGPWIGALDNGGESVELYKPDPPQTLPPDVGFVPSIRVDKVRYNNHEPWPVLADGQGPSLKRRVPANFGDNPANWFTDFDGDGMADDWEVSYQLSPFYAGDAGIDSDGDELTNIEEFFAGTDPRNASGLLRILYSRRDLDQIIFGFGALANQTYSVYYTDRLDGGVWNRHGNYAAGPSDGVIEVSDWINTGAARFYRVVTPQQP
jgi:hypothetical protein